jgi:arylsulfatase
MNISTLTRFLTIVLVVLFASVAVAEQPNIVLIFMDNFGYGELGCYGGGITRGGATPRIDKLADEGLRLLNFNVEAQCTPSRAAIMTGRYAVRSGCGSVPITTGMYGLTQWEVTMAEMLSDAGYATGMFGKWHLGHTKGRFPTDQGFDEWYGIPNSTDESLWPDQAQFNAVVKENLSAFAVPEYIYDGKKGSDPKKVRIYDSSERPEIDRECTNRAKDFIKRQANAKKPFFAFLPLTQTHMPVVPSSAFDGKSGNGNWGDVLMQIDAYTGELLDTLDEFGISDNTIFIFTADNGPEMLPGHHGWSGPWRGSYFTGLEGSLRVPFIVRWPGKVPAGQISNEIVHEMDLFATFAKFSGGSIPSDRHIDSVDQSDFLLGKQEKSNRDGVIVYVGEELFGVKWRNWKMMFQALESGKGTDARITHDFPHFFNLYRDPKEMYPITTATAGDFWVRWPMGELLKVHEGSFAKEPPIPTGTPDPYTPKQH